MNNDKLRDIFNQAVELTGTDRTEYLDEACGADDALRSEVESLLGHYATEATVQDNTTDAPPGTYQQGDTIGPYTILSTLGEGGMGMVYLAQQAKPVRRRVALKVIKAGMDSKQVIARFQAERQALALMNHPGIASVYEAGMTEDARPYFVMEYIEGTSITEACDAQHLDTTQRLELMAEVCDAVQHAHQKGVIHRDLKPGNILVSRGDDDRLRPTIIDFGVAKATSQDLTEMTYMTQQGHLVGTPAYMSPEQVDLNIADIDTRSDVYALGVIMYEVITGRPPFDPRSLWDAGLEEMRRIIREEEPPRPSTWLSTTGGEEAAKIAQARQTEVASLSRLLGRELEWIPLKALRKERSERYDSAKDMAEDIRRYLSGQPLEAGPESAMYRLRKAVRRNKGAFTAAAIVCLVLIAGVVISLGFAFEADREREAAIQARDEAETEKNRAEAVKDFVTTMLSSVDPDTAGAMDKELMMLVLSQAATSAGEQFQDQPLTEAEIRSVIGRTYINLGRYDEAEPHIVASLVICRRVLGDEHPDTLGSISTMGDLLYSQGKYDEAMPYYVEALETYSQVFGDEHPSTLGSIGRMGNLFISQGKHDEAWSYYVEALETSRRVLGDEHPHTLVSISAIGGLLYSQGKYDEAEPYYVEALETSRRVLGDEHPITLGSISRMGILFISQGKYDEAEPYCVEALETYSQVLGDEHPSTLLSISVMGGLLSIQGKHDEAMPYYVVALETSRRVLGDEHPSTLGSISRMGNLFYSQGKYDEAMPYYVEALETYSQVLGDEHPDTLLSISTMGDLLYSQGKYDEAEPHIVASLVICRRVLGDEHPSTLLSIIAMGNLLYSQGKYDEAMPYYVEALETSRRVLGDEHPDTLDSISTMGDLFYSQDKYDEAMPYYVEALETSRRVLGDEHPDTLVSIGDMGNLLYSQGKYDEAMPYYVEALETSRCVLGDEHPDTIVSISRMGILFISQGKHDEAWSYYVEALETSRRVLGDEHPDTLVSIGDMGDLLYSQGKHHEGWSYYVEALETSRRVLGDEHPDTQAIINKLVPLKSLAAPASHAPTPIRQLLEDIRANTNATAAP